MEITPKISVVLPYFNRHDYIEKSLGAIVNQSYQPYECIIVDDCSELSSYKKLEGIVEQFNKKASFPIKLVRKEKNGGGPSARNVGIEYVTGDWVAAADSDDFWRVNKLERQVAWMEQGVDVLHAAAEMHYGDGKSSAFMDKPEYLTAKDLYYSSQIVHPTMLVKTDVMRAIGKYDESFRISGDYEITLRLVSKGYKVRFQPEVLIDVTRTGHDSASSPKNMFVALSSMNKLWWRYRSFLKGSRPGNDSFLSNHWKRLGLRKGGAIGRGLWLIGCVLPI